MIIVESSASEQSTVRMEGGARDGRGAGVMEETRVGLEGREMRTVDVERFDFVAICATNKRVSQLVSKQGQTAVKTKTKL